MGVTIDLADEDRASEAGNFGVGVPIEARLSFGGGGPMEPVANLAGVEVEGTPPFARTLLPSAFGVSNPRILSLPVSESAEGGLTIPGVEYADESRR